MATLWPLAVYLGATLAIVAGIVTLSYLLGERHEGKARGEPYESGILQTTSARLRVSAKFYLVAMFFVIFDVETAFVLAWAVSFRATGWAGYAAAMIFIGILLVALVYLWRAGALDWGTSPNRKRSCNETGKQNGST